MVALGVALGGCGRKRVHLDSPSSRDAQVVTVMVPRDAGLSYPKAIHEKEPDDSPSQAVNVPVGRAVMGFVGKPIEKGKGDRDFFRFHVPEGQWVLWAHVTGVPGLRVVLEVREGKGYGRLTKVTAGRMGQGVTLPNLTLSSGTYYFQVRERWMGSKRHWDLKHPYFLTWKLSSTGPGQEREPNDHEYEAMDVVLGHDVSGYLGRYQDRDWYKVSFGGLSRQTTIKVALDGVPSVRAEVALFDAHRRLLASRRGGRGRAVVFRNLALDRTDGYFYVRVRAVAGFSTEAQYELRVEADGSGPGSEREPNDSVSAAMRLSGDNGDVAGVIESVQDQDTFRFDVAHAKTLRVEVVPDEQLDVEVALLDAKGRGKVKANAGRRGYHEILSNVRLSRGASFVRVSSARRHLAHSAAYHLKWRIVSVEKGDEVEPNDSVGRATHIRLGVSARGFIYPPGDVDYYWFAVPGPIGGTVRIRASVQGIPKVRLHLTLLDGMKNILGEDSKLAAPGRRQVEINLHMGKRYYLRLAGESKRRSNSVDSYDLELTRVW